MRSPLLIQNGCVAAGDSPAVFRPVQRGRVARGHIAILALLFLLLILNYSARAQANTSSNSSEHSAASGELTKEAREAAAEAEEHAQFRHSWMVQSVAKLTGLNLDGAYWLCLVLNFAIVAGAIGYYSKKILPGMFRNRTASIQKAMQEARKASEDANRRLAEIEARLSRLDTEIAAMRATAEKEASRGRGPHQGRGGRRWTQDRGICRAGDCGGGEIGATGIDQLRGESSGLAGGQTDQSRSGHGPGVGARVCPRAFAKKWRTGQELNHGFRDQHLRACLRRRGL